MTHTHCSFVDEPPTDEGYHSVRCVKCGWSWDKSPNPAERVHRNCNGAPGLGDRIAKVFDGFGITWFVKKVKEECNCSQRIRKCNIAGAAVKQIAKDVSGWSMILELLKFITSCVKR